MEKNCFSKLAITKADDGIRINIRVIPNASRCEIVGILDRDLKIKLDVPPIEGKANDKCVKYLSKLLGVSKSFFSIICGGKSRSKVLFIKGNPEELEKKLISCLVKTTRLIH